MKKIKSFLIAVLILILVFIIGFFGINVAMKIVVGHGNEVKVPDIIGMNYAVARKQCKGFKLYVQEEELLHNDEIEKGRIISQNPHPNILTKKYRTISVVVSKGPEMVRIPYLDNLSIREAKLKLENAGLFLGNKIYRYSDVVKKNRIVYSRPNADDLIARKSEVDVIISLGELPDASDKYDKYKNLLEGAGD